MTYLKIIISEVNFRGDDDMGVLTYIKMLPKLLVVLYVVIVFISSLAVSIRESDAKIFFVEGIGPVLGGTGKSLEHKMDVMIEKKEERQRDFVEFFAVLGDFLVFYYVIKLIYLFFNKFMEMVSPAIVFGISVLILFLIQTIYFTAISGSFQVGFIGLGKFFLHIDSFFYPVADWIAAAGDISIRSPFL